MNSGNVAAQMLLSQEGWAIGVVRQNVKYSDFTKSTQYGTLTMRQTIPAGSLVIGTRVDVHTAFNGGTNNLVVGQSSGEDEYSNGTTIAVGTTGLKGSEPEQGEKFNAAEQSVYLRIDEGSDWDDVTAGQMCVEVVFLMSDVDQIARGYKKRKKF